MAEPTRLPAALSFSLLVYRWMLRVYPAPFRQEYGDWMYQVFRDCNLSVWQHHRPGALLALWSRMLADYFLSVLEQYANRGVEMSRSMWIKGSGWGLVVSGFIWVIGWLASTRPEFSPYNAASWPVDRYLNAAVIPLMAAGVALATVGVWGIRARFNHQVRGLGTAGLYLSTLSALITLAGVIGLGITDGSPWWEMTMLGMTGFFVGLLLFGVDCLRLKLFSRWNALPLLIAIPWPVLALASLLYRAATRLDFLLPELALVLLMILIFGGLALTGYRLQADTPQGWSPLRS